MEDFVFFLSFSLHFFLDCLLGVFKLPTDIVVGDVLIVVNVPASSPRPNEEHAQCPYEEENEYDACTDEELVRHVVVR